MAVITTRHRTPSTMAVFVSSVFLFLFSFVVVTEGALPVITDPAFNDRFNVSEIDPKGTLIVTVQATDPDNDTITYSINAGTPGSFTIDPVTGELRVAEQLDFETPPNSYKISVFAAKEIDPTQRDSIDIFVDVTDVNDSNFPPKIDVTEPNVTLPEESPVGTPVPFVFNASDPLGDNIKYALLGPDAVIFDIDENTGNVTLNTKVDIDKPPSKTEYVVTIEVMTQDMRVTTSNTTLMLTFSNINDNAPKCVPNVLYPSVDEESTMTTLTTLNCNDADYLATNDFTFALVGGNTTVFGVDPNTGDVTADATGIDYDTMMDPTIVLKIKVTDKDSPPMSSTATVVVVVKAVNDNPPMMEVWNPSIPADNQYMFPENTAIGTSLFTIMASDADKDVGDELTYTITVLDGTNPEDGVFFVESDTGKVTLIGNLDAESAVTNYTLKAVVSDGVATDTMTVYIIVGDVNDNVPRIAPVGIKFIDEEVAKDGYSVLNFTATDKDVSADPTMFEYMLASVSPAGSASVWLLTSDGMLSLVRDLDLDVAMDPDEYRLEIVVNDKGTPSSLTGTTFVTIRITPDNEFEPTIVSEPGSTPVMVPEDESAGTRVAMVVATDEDVGPEGELMYSIIGGNTADAFEIDNMGNISTQIVLDRETVDMYNLTIQIMDSGDPAKRRNITTVVMVVVTDVSDQLPECEDYFIIVSLDEEEPVNIMVTMINCTDADPSDTLTYSVPLNPAFDFTPMTNELVTKMVLDYDDPLVKRFYDLDVTVTDGINNRSVRVRVNLVHVNEFPPNFPTNGTKSITENEMVNNPFLIYTATDGDASPDDVVSYSIKSVDPSTGMSLFAIDGNSGALNLLSQLDYETSRSYVIEVEATDGGGMMGSGYVTIDVIDANDSPPMCDPSIYQTEINETEVANFTLMLMPDLNCTDPEGGTLTYKLTRQSPGFEFEVTVTGEVMLNGSVNYETSASHILTIEVDDGGSPTLASTITVFVNVLNENQGPPEFPLGVLLVDVNETASIGDFVIDVIATDPDGDDPMFGDPQYSIVGGTMDLPFIINPASGRLSVSKPIDFESLTDPKYSFLVKAEDRGGLSAERRVNITILDVNDEDPMCNPDFISETVMEEGSIGPVAMLMCNDSDAGTVLTYNISSGNTSLFEMVSDELRLKMPLDFESEQFHSLSITVSDGDPTHDIEVPVVITVGSKDEGPPVFNSGPFVVNVSEDTSVPTFVYTVMAVDPDSDLDENGQIKYSFDGSYPNFFIDPDSGEISLLRMLDREKQDMYDLMVKASDATGSNSVKVTVMVTDVNDNTPKFMPASYSGTLSEMDPEGKSILTVTATDLDDPNTMDYGTVMYAIEPASTDFGVDPMSGEITNRKELDADPSGKTLYTFNVTATDSNGTTGARTGFALVTITVTTLNQYEPMFMPGNISVTINETQFSPGDVILRVTASDADTGLDGEFVMELENEPTFYLTQNGSEGEIHLGRNLDFDNGDTTFMFEITATDKGSPSLTGTVTVTVNVDDVNDNPPLCGGTIFVVRKENTTDIAQLSCMDKDGTTVFSYTILSVTPNSISPDVAADGMITVSTPLDYETSPSYTIMVEVKDGGTPALSTTVTVYLRITDINDNLPSFTGPFSFKVNETDVADNTVLYTANATGNDGPSETVTYTLDDDTYFEISATSGDVFLKSDAPDYETESSMYTLEICAKDTPNPTSYTTCQNVTVEIVDVNDEPPVFNPTVYSVTVREDVAPGTILAEKVTATDADVTPAFHTITYSIVADNSMNVWSITNDGEIKVESALDAETRQEYTLVIEASDGVNTANVTYFIKVTSVNEFAPVFDPPMMTTEVPEDLPLNSVLNITYNVTDEDIGRDGMFTYSIDSGPFSINPTTGSVTLIRPLDRETKTSYTLIIRATDMGMPKRQGNMTLIVGVKDVNDNTPTCSSSIYTASPLENAPGGTLVTSIACQDIDKDPDMKNNMLTYDITSGDTIMFGVTNNGEVMVKSGAMLDREKVPNYVLVVKVADEGTPPLSTSVTVEIALRDVNDNDPVITSLPNKTVAEDTAIGTVVGTVMATDEDIGMNGEIMYVISNGNAGNKFRIDPDRGIITVNGILDHEMMPMYELEITVADKGPGPRKAVGTATVTIADANDSPPICPTALYLASVEENMTGQKMIADVNCTDEDTVGSITYSITAGDPSNNFEIDPTSGEVMTASGASFDFETEDSYLLEVTATDGIHSARTYIKVMVVDMDEFPPVFDPNSPYSVVVMEDEMPGAMIYDVNATDQDTNDMIMYKIVGGNDDGKFIIDTITGMIQLQGELDYEMTKQYKLDLEIMDMGGMKSTNEITINVGDVNDHPPVCTVRSEIISVDEDMMSGTLFTPNCDDADKVASPNVMYRIKSGTEHPSVSVDTTTGVLSLVNNFDYEMMTFHDLVIEAYDDGTPEMSTDIYIRITINPINEFPPVFMPSDMYGPIMVKEDEPSGFTVTRVNATDKDKGLQQGTVRYMITGGNMGDHFRIDIMTGEIEILNQLDRETMDNFNLTIKAEDDEPDPSSAKSSFATVSIVVTDVNDHTPMFAPSFYRGFLYENDTANTQIVQVTATDMDDPNTMEYGKVMYAIEGGSADFTIDPMTGMISNRRMLSADSGQRMYTLTVIATDSGNATGALTGTADVNIMVRTVNQHPPVFNQTQYDITVNEGEKSPGDVLLMVYASDADAGMDGEFTIEFLVAQTKFALIQDGMMASIILMEDLDFDNGDKVFDIGIKATDKGMPPMMGQTSVTINVNDVNDNPPLCTRFIRVEKPEMGRDVTTLSCTDKDTNTVLNYAVISTTPSTITPLVSSIGVVTVKDPLDYENAPSHMILIGVDDGVQTATVTIDLFIVDSNDNAPSLMGPFTFDVREDAMIDGATLYQAVGQGNDGPKDTVTYSLKGTSYFNIEPDTGKVYLKSQAPDYEKVGPSIVMELCVTDTLNPVPFTECETLTANITDANDNPPIFNPSVYSDSVAENMPVGHMLLPVTATDMDSSMEFRNITYSIVAGNMEGKFSIDMMTGNVMVADMLDYETTMSYTLVIQASDSVFKINATYTIEVTPVNEHPPVFSSSSLMVMVPENASLSYVVTTVTASDADMGRDGMFFFTIESGPFAIGSMDGVITVVRPLDRETVESYELTVRAIDRGVPSMTGNMTLTVEITDVNDHAPDCGNIFYSVSLMENTKDGHLVMMLNCTDADDDPDMLNNKLSYRLDPGNLMDIDSNGVIRVKAGTVIDREQSPMITEVVEVTDNAKTNPQTTMVEIQITVLDENDNAPFFTSLPVMSSATVPEDKPIGSTVLTVNAIDTDEGMNGQIMYSITDGNTGNHFRIDPMRGSIIIQAKLDYETMKMYMLEITAMDKGMPPMSASGTVTITVTDVNDNMPMCNMSLYTVSIPEDSTNLMVKVTCSDMDMRDTLTYSIMDGDPNSMFEIDSSTGTITLASGAILDYEAAQSHTLMVMASDGMNSANTTVKVIVEDVDESDPMFDPPGPYAVDVMENMTAGSTVFTVMAMDADTFDNFRRFSIVSGNDDGLFNINPVSGVVQLQGVLDYEMTQRYTLTLMVEDSGGRMSTTMLTVNVTDINDNDPVCQKTSVVVSVDEDESNLSLFTPACDDADKMASPNVMYKIMSGALSSLSIDMTTGELMLVGMLDYENMTSHDVVIEAYDDGMPVRFTTINVRININPVNELDPEYMPSNMYGPIMVPEDTPAGTSVAKVEAMDEDKGMQQGTVRYSIVGGNMGNHFSIDMMSGEIEIASMLDREMMDALNITVRATDDQPGSPDARSADANVFFMVTDVNDNPPVFSPSVYRGELFENDTANTDIVQVMATDMDDPNTNDYGKVTYSIDDPAADFYIDPMTGMIRNRRVLDSGQITSNVYTLTVVATDSRGQPGALNATALVYITVKLVNQHAPEFIPDSYEVTVNETSAIGDLLVTVTASDIDMGLGGEFTVDFVSPQTKFTITQTGKMAGIRLKENLDFDNGDQMFVLGVMATDKGSPPMRGTATVTINVNDINDSPPMCTSLMTVMQQEGATYITSLACTDSDTSSMITYSVVSVMPNTISPMVSQAGVVTVTKPLDYENAPRHEIIINAEDGGMTASVTIDLLITDINDNDPVLMGPFSFSVKESDMPSNVSVYMAKGMSKDGPTDTVMYSINDTTYFSIAKDTGDMYLKRQAPDFETMGPEYMLKLCVMDSPNPVSRTACEPLTVMIEDVNDNEPMYNPSVYSVSVAENTAVGHMLMPVMATDMDASTAFNTITYSIIEGNSEGKFRVLMNGSLEIIDMLDYEKTMSYSLVIEASDSFYKTNASYTVQVMPVNEFSPTFTSSMMIVSVAENVPMNQLVTMVTATDGDKGRDGMIMYKIEPGPFAIDPMSGEITVVKSIDRETKQSYMLTVWAIDRGMPSKNGTMMLTVNIDDVNDNEPNCGATFYAVSLMENVGAGAPVIKLTCSDADMDPAGMNNKLTYMLDPDTMFEIDALGMIRVKQGAVIDREMEDMISVMVTVADSSPVNPMTTMVMVNATIQDVNDNAPMITNLPFTLSLAEDEPVEKTVFTVMAEDEDAGRNGEVMYKIKSGNVGDHFRIDSMRGDIVLQKMLDYDVMKMFMLEIEAMDRGMMPLSTTGMINITVTDVNNNAPVCMASSNVMSVPEDSKDMMVATVSCSDADMVGTVTYSITKGDPMNNFEIDSKTGEIRVRPNASLDYETTQSYALEITASDGMQSTTTIVRVAIGDVNEASPVFKPPVPYNISVREDVDVGTEMYRAMATDADTLDTNHRFSITAGNDGDHFLIEPTTGRIKVLNPLDHEMRISFTLTLQVMDSTGLMDTTTLTINVIDVNDNAPMCTDMATVVDVDEGVSSGVLYTPDCTDADTAASPQLQYSIMSGGHQALNIDPFKGTLSLLGAFDYEKMTSHNLVIEVRDNGTPALFTTINVTILVNPVNEFSPVFMPATYGPVSVMENSPKGTFVIQVTATDQDKGMHQGTVRYSIFGDDPQQMFMIDEATGHINVSRPLDREAMEKYTLTVKAVDCMPGSPDMKTADATVQIMVGDVNDVTPVFRPALYTVDVEETAVAGPNVVLIQLTVQDDDIGINSQTVIRIISGNEELKFAIDGMRLILVNMLDYETTSSYELGLEVSDGGLPRLSSEGKVIVRVLPDNDNAPLMTSASVTKTIPEDTPVGTLVYDANATDADGGMNGQITYSIESGVSNNEFIINPQTGELFVGSELDFDMMPTSYTIVIRAADEDGRTSPQSTVSLSIILSDVNDHTPQFSLTTYTFNVNENVKGADIGMLNVTDKDSGDNGKITLMITGGSGQNFFTLDSMTIKTAAEIDYETNKVLFLTVTATDSGNPAKKSECVVKININNMNDNDPVIAPADFAITVPENTSIGTTVQMYSASDMDTSIAAFMLAAPNAHFMIDATNGAVTVKATLDRETMESQELMVIVMDRATTADSTVRNATAKLTIMIGDVNDNDPIITGVYSASLPESTELNTLVFHIMASDADSGLNSQLFYAITAGNTNGAFKIDNAGNVLVAKPLDTDLANRYTLTITVRDSGSPSRSASISAEVRVENVNNRPVFERAVYAFTVDENSLVGTTVGTVSATDTDIGPNGQLTYSFGAFTEGTGSHFSIGLQSGVITVAMNEIDWETIPIYRATVIVMDAGSPARQSASVSLTITVNNLDDNPFVLNPDTYTASVAENSATGTNIVQVIAPDVGFVSSTPITYSIDTSMMDGSKANQLLMVKSDGFISVQANIDYEAVKSLNFRVNAMKGGKTATANVTIIITDVNDNTPVIMPTYVNTEVAYTGECEDTIAEFTATDADSGANGEVIYEQVTIDFANIFSINSVTGRLTMETAADVNKEYDIVIRARDRGTPERSSSATVRVDTFAPFNYVAKIKLEINREAFMAEKQMFLANLQKLFRKTYPTALVRVWCVSEYVGQSQAPSKSVVKRQTSDSPVEVMVYVLKDNKTESINSIGSEKTFLSQVDIYNALTAANDGTPSADLSGSEFSYFRISEVDNYKEEVKSSDDWWDTVYGPLITALLIALALILLAVFIFCCCRRCGGKDRSSDRKTLSSQEDSQGSDWRRHAALRDAEYGIPYARAYPAGVLYTDDEHNLYAPKRSRFI